MMLALSVLYILSLSSIALASDWDTKPSKRSQCSSHKPTIHYTTIGGFFLQDDPATDDKTFDYTTVNYGLIDRSYPTDEKFDKHSTKTQWQRFEHYVNTLNHDAEKDTQYKVLFMARHGEGYHNAAESYYGTPAWNCYWGPLDGNGTSVWRDARLTSAGLAQCSKSGAFWRQALSDSAIKIPAPQSYYSSPLTRSATTANLTFGDLGSLLPADRPFAPTIKELLREGVSIRSCDARSDRSTLAALLPASFNFESGFAEKDPLWRGSEGEGETGEEMMRRTKEVFDDIFSHDENTWLSLTTHSGQISASLRVLGHRVFGLSTGQAVPALVKAVTRREPTTTVTSSSPAFTSEVTCDATPVTSVAGQGCVCSGTEATAEAAATAIVAASPV